MFAPLVIWFWLAVVLAALAGGVALLVLAAGRRSWRHALAGGALHELRVVIVDDDYRIIEQPGDPDGRVRWKGFTRTSSRPGTN